MYKIKQDENGNNIIILTQDNNIISFVENSNNRHYQEYLEWVAEGNTPEEAE
jgi:hypothetical protein